MGTAERIRSGIGLENMENLGDAFGKFSFLWRSYRGCLWKIWKNKIK
jgi:hypothetical protein